MKLLMLLLSLIAVIGSLMLSMHDPASAAPTQPMRSVIAVAPARPTPPPSAAVPAPPPSAASNQTSNGKPRDVVRVNGAADAVPLLAEIANIFEATPDAPRVEVKATSIEAAKQILAAGTSFEFALISRELKDDERYLKAHPVAYRGLSLVVNAANPVASLDDQQLAALLQGAKVKWADVGGGDAPINLYQLIGPRAVTTPLYEALAIKPDKIVNAIAQSDDARELVRRVGSDVGGIALVPYVAVSSQETRDTNKVKLLAYKGVDPSAASIRDGSYDLAFPILLLTRGEPEDGPARNFLRFITSDTVQDRLRNALLLPGR